MMMNDDDSPTHSYITGVYLRLNVNNTQTQALIVQSIEQIGENMLIILFREWSSWLQHEWLLLLLQFYILNSSIYTIVCVWWYEKL